jgi:exodeoxyribonuclease V beta subunit
MTTTTCSRGCATLGGPAATTCGAPARALRVVLVDEFQDTDPLQWEIVRRAFADTGAAVVLIGDPKQAIYAFRGADVHAYLDAARRAGERATLGTNWRSDAGLLRAFDALFGEARLGHPQIVYRRTAAAADGGRAGGRARRTRPRCGCGSCTATTPAS